MKVIAVTGMPGSGKGVFVSSAKKRGYPVVRMGDCVWEKVKEYGLELTDANVGRIASEEREKHGKDIWAKRTAEKCLSMQSDIIFIDGVRSTNEVNTFREFFKTDFIIIAILSGESARYSRLSGRGREDDISSLEEFRRRDEREISWGIKEVIKSSNVSIVNESEIEAFNKVVNNVLDKVISL